MTMYFYYIYYLVLIVFIELSKVDDIELWTPEIQEVWTIFPSLQAIIV